MTFIQALRLFMRNHSAKEAINLLRKIVIRPVLVFTLFKLFLQKDFVTIRHGITGLLGSSNGLKFNYTSSKIETDIEEWLKFMPANSCELKFTIIVPLYKPDIDLLMKLIRSIEAQTYDNWELLLVADGLETFNILMESPDFKSKVSGNSGFEDIDVPRNTHNRLECLLLQNNVGIAKASRAGIDSATGDYILLVDQDDLISKNALDVIGRSQINNFDAAYSDHCIIDMQDNVVGLFKKPDWSPILATQVMYFGHIKCFKREIIDKYYLPIKDSQVQDHMAMLQAGINGGKILHIPLVLASWRMAPNSIATDFWNKPTVTENFQHEVNQLLRLINPEIAGRVLSVASNKITLMPTNAPLDQSIQVIIPTMWKDGLILKLLPKILELPYENLVVTLVDTNENERPEALDTLCQAYPDRLKILNWNTRFNYSAVNNYASGASASKYILFLNDDVLPLTSDWLDHMLAVSNFNNTGAIGAKLLYPNGTIQHGGVALGPRGTADHMYRFQPQNSDFALGSSSWTREVSAVTAACMLIKRSVFESIGGFSEEYEIAYQDVDLCLRIAKLGLSNVQAQNAILMHIESASRGPDYSIRDRDVFVGNWMMDFDRDGFDISDFYSSTSN
jgi:GT2 family glycosyltransferase